MADNRDEILMNFLAVAGTDDYGRAFEMLELAGWDLMQAVALNASVNAETDPATILSEDFKASTNPFDVLKSTTSTTTRTPTATQNKKSSNNSSASSNSKKSPPAPGLSITGTSLSSQNRVRTSKSSGNVEVNIVNKHDRRHWQKSYPSGTSVKTVREEAAAHFRIPFEVA